MNSRIQIAVLLVGALLLSQPTHAQEQVATEDQAVEPLKKKKPGRLYRSDDILTLEILAPFSDIFSKRGEDRPEFPAKLILVEGELRTEFDITLKLRGNSRAQRGTCNFPPLRVRFDKEQTKDTIFHKQGSVKLGTHCKTRNSRYVQNTLTEYFLYRVFNIVTEESFRVRLADIKYFNEDGSKLRTEAYGFFIERPKRAAERLGMERVRQPIINVNDVDPVAASRNALFQFMIGNLDWSVLAAQEGEDCCHNYKPLRTPGEPVTPIPYDFDQSGAVDAEYASSYMSFKLRSARSRLWRGFCLHNAEVAPRISEFQAKRAEIETLYKTIPVVNESRYKRLMSYFDDFYEIIGNPKEVQKQIMDKCRT